MTAAGSAESDSAAARRRLWPLYAAGFTTAFGAHGVAASLGSPDGVVRSLVSLGLLLALYDLAEVVLKPVFGALADRIGARPVLLGGLLGFAGVSALYALVGGTPALWAVRLGQGIAASAFSPSASALVARLGGAKRRGRAYGGYGLFKSLGYTLGPLLGGLLVHLGGMRLLIGVMAVVALLVAGWCAVAVPALERSPRKRQTVVDLARNIVHPTFLIPVTGLALGTAALSVGVGFLPVSGGSDGLGALATGAIVSVLALSSAVVQPLAGTALDRGRLPTRFGLTGGLIMIAAGMACATQSTVAFLVLAAMLIGIGVGVVTPVGFAALADRTPEAELGRTMGTAELGRELGDAGGPLLVGVLAAAYGLASGYLVLMIITVVGAGMVFWWSRRTARADVG